MTDFITYEVYQNITKIGDPALTRKAALRLRDPVRSDVLKELLAADVEHGKLDSAYNIAGELGRSLTTEELLNILICWITEENLAACAINHANGSPEPMRTALLSGILSWSVTSQKLEVCNCSPGWLQVAGVGSKVLLRS